MKHSESAAPQDGLYQSLWDEAVTVKNANMEFSTALDKLVESVRNDVLPMEIELGELLNQVLGKQLGFCQRRALSEQHRDELHFWIEENVHTIKQMGMADEDILEKSALAHAKFKKIPLDHNSDVSVSDQVDQYYADQIARGKEDTGAITNAIVDDHSEPNISTLNNSSANASVHDESDKLEANHNDLYLSDLDDGVFQKLFRKIANALHPDKEPDDLLREKKQQLMGSLLEARKNYDLISLMELHNEYVGDSPEPSVEDKRSLATVLYHFIQQEKSAADSPIFHSSLHVSAYKRFYDPAAAERNAKLTSYVARLKERREAYSCFANDINTLFKLGVVLDRRILQKSETHSINTHGLAPTIAAKPDANNRSHSERYEHE